MTVPTAADNATVSRVAASATVVTIKAANSGRRTLSLYNESSAVLTLKHGATATTTDYTVLIGANTFYELPQPVYRGILTGLWASATGAVQVTEGF